MTITLSKRELNALCQHLNGDSLFRIVLLFGLDRNFRVRLSFFYLFAMKIANFGLGL